MIIMVALVALGVAWGVADALLGYVRRGLTRAAFGHE